MQTNRTADVIEQSLIGLGKRLDATARNIANMNTPQYPRREVSFEDQLHDVLHEPARLPLVLSSPDHISNVTLRVEDVKPIERPIGTEVYRGDSNNVDPETETARMTESRMMYTALAARLQLKFRELRRILSGGASS